MGRPSATSVDNHLTSPDSCRFVVAKMKLNISYPANGSQKLVEIEDERKLRIFMDRRMGQEVPGDSVGDEFKGYIFKITGGNDKQGFPMKQGVMHPTRVRLLLSAGHSCYRPRKTGERKRKSVRGCIVALDLAVLALAVVKQGDNDIPGLTDTVHPKRLGPKRATKIRRFFGLSKEDDVRKFVIRREVQPKKEGAKPYTKAPHPAPGHSPASPAQAPPDRTQASPGGGCQGRGQRLRPDHAQACLRGEGQAGRDQEEACFQHAQVDYERSEGVEESAKSWHAFAMSEERRDTQRHEHRKGVFGVLSRSIHLAAMRRLLVYRKAASLHQNFTRLFS